MCAVVSEGAQVCVDGDVPGLTSFSGRKIEAVKPARPTSETAMSARPSARSRASALIRVSLLHDGLWLTSECFAYLLVTDGADVSLHRRRDLRLLYRRQDGALLEIASRCEGDHSDPPLPRPVCRYPTGVSKEAGDENVYRTKVPNAKLQPLRR